MQASNGQLAAYTLAREAIGTKEVPGRADHNPDVVEYFHAVGHTQINDDETPWCAAFIGAMLERSGVRSTRRLNARSYLNWGEPVAVDDAQPGDVVVFSRDGAGPAAGHVAFFVRPAGHFVVVLGGNQGNEVKEARYRADTIIGVRRDPAPQQQARRESLVSSRTMAGAATVTVGTTGATAVTEIQASLDQAHGAISPMAEFLPVVRWVLIGLVLVGVALTVYARLDDWRKGKR